jgi:hypothetical protein
MVVEKSKAKALIYIVNSRLNLQRREQKNFFSSHFCVR